MLDNKPSPSSPSRLQIALWASALAAAVLLALSNFQGFQIGVYQDDSEYAVLAESLAWSTSYGLINAPGEAGDTRYPVGFPLVLAPFSRLFPGNLEALKLPSLLATVANGILLFWGWRYFGRTATYWLGLGCAALYLLSPQTIGHTRMVMSEPIFLTFTLAAIMLTERMRHSSRGLVNCLVLGVCLSMSVLIRTVGAILVIAIIGYLFALRGRTAMRDMIGVAAGGVMALGLLVGLTSVGAGDILPLEYRDQFQNPSQWGQSSQEDDLGLRLSAAARDYLTLHIRTLLLPIGGGAREQATADRLGLSFLPSLVGLAVVGLIVVGYWVRVRKEGASLAPLFSILYLGAILLWPWRGPRFLYPVQPQLVLGLLTGVALLASRVGPALQMDRPRLMQAAMAAVVAGLLGIYVYKSLLPDDSRWHTGDLALRSAWIRDNAETSAIIMTEQPQTDYLYGQRKTVSLPHFNSAQNLQEYLAANGVTYIVIAPQLNWQSSYSPILSDAAIQTQSLLQGLESDQLAALVYVDDTRQVSVYKVSLDAE